MGSLTDGATRPGGLRATGFTLVEILVVLVVLGTAAALLVAAIDRDPRRVLGSEARRLGGALEHAAALAQWTGETFGVSAAGTTYRFWRRTGDGQWSAVADDDVLAPRRLPDDVSVGIASYAGAPVAPDAVLPFRTSGRNEPFVIVMAAPGAAALLASDALNRVGVVERVPEHR